MNPHAFRLVFNKSRQMLMAVSECATSSGKSSVESKVSRIGSPHRRVFFGQSNRTEGSRHRSSQIFSLRPLSSVSLLIFGFLSFSISTLPFFVLPSFVGMAHAQIVADKTAPKNQQAIILPSANGTSIVNIQTPSGAGVSRNTYSQFDVNRGNVAQASTLGVIDGNLTIVAGKNYEQIGSHLLTPNGDIGILAQNIAITEARESQEIDQRSWMKQSGFTLAVSSPVLSALQTASSMIDAAKDVTGKNKGRMEVLALANAGFSSKEAYDAIKAGQGTTINGKDNQFAVMDDKGSPIKDASGNPVSKDATAADKAGGISISLTYGESKSETKSSQKTNSAAGSSLSAGGNISLVATGRGSDAASDVNTLLPLGEGLGMREAAAKDPKDGNIVIQGSHLATGKTVTADIGGNLHIESLQDTASYDAKQQNIGGSVTVGMGASGSASYSDSKIKSDYASVNEQSGFRATGTTTGTTPEAGGFDITVKGDTTLIGGVIASTQEAVEQGLNHFETGTLSTSSIQNHSEASAESSSIGLGSNMLSQGKLGIAKVGMGLLGQTSDSTSEDGFTQSAISGGEIHITNESSQLALTGKTAEQTIADLNRDASNAHQGVEKQDVEALRKTVEASTRIKEEFINHVGKFTDEAYRVMFEEKAKIYTVARDSDGKPLKDEQGKLVYREVPQEEWDHLQKGADGKVPLYTNGIFNDLQTALEYSLQKREEQYADSTDSVYLVYFPEAKNPFSELMVAGYQKALEGTVGELANPTYALKDLLYEYGNSGLSVGAHSRGGMTLGNGMTTLINESKTKILTNTSLIFFGSADNAQEAANHIYALSGGQVNSVFLQNHNLDFVGTWIGGNSGTYGSTSEGKSVLGERINMFTGKETVHACTGNWGGEDACNKTYGKPITSPVFAKPSIKGDAK